MEDFKFTAEPSTPFMLTEAVFPAASEKVFAAFIDRDKLEQWWLTAPGYHVRVDILEPENGGRWQFSCVDEKSGQGHMFRGSFHEVTHPYRIIWTFEVATQSERGHVSLERFDFEAIDGGKTNVRSTTAFLCLADRDWMLQSGTEAGLRQSYERLAEILL